MKMPAKNVFPFFYLSLIILFVTIPPKVFAKSVYAITDHGYRQGFGVPSKISTYGIDGDQIDLQFTLVLDDVNYPTGDFHGPVGLAIDTVSEYMFVTHEGKGDIQIIDASTMTDYGWSEAPGVIDLAGIVYDQQASKVYAIERSTNGLFVFSWDSQSRTLTLDGNEPVQLAEIGDYGCGLALDEFTDTLYVSSIGGLLGHTADSNIVHYYNTSDFSHQGTIEIKVGQTGYNAVAIAVYDDGQGTRYLYSGSYSWQGQSENHLVRTDLLTL
jgi:DNA-binding beta-propeller fold protein YncE